MVVSMALIYSISSPVAVLGQRPLAVMTLQIAPRGHAGAQVKPVPLASSRKA